VVCNASMYMVKLGNFSVLIALVTTYGAFLVLNAGSIFCSGRVYYPFKLVSCCCTIYNLTATDIGADFPVIISAGVPAFFGNMGECWNDQLFCGNFGLGFVKQLMANRALVICFFTICAALCRHFRDQVAVFMLNTGNGDRD